MEESRSVQDAPTLLVSEKGAGLLNTSPNSLLSYPPAKVDTSYYNEDDYDNNEWVTRVRLDHNLQQSCLVETCEATLRF